MFLPYNRMIVGQPLKYFPPYGQSSPKDSFSYFNKFERFTTPMEPTEDYPMITSPTNSVQSDSDNSVSSIEVPSHAIEIPRKEEKKQCMWKNCGIVFLSLQELAGHVAQCHSAGGPDGLFYCGWEGCTRNNRGFNARYKMLVHVRTHTNEKPHRCFQCDKSFSRAENLKIHSRSHSGEKPYICPVPGCGKAYSNSSDRFKHTRTHSVEKPYQCKIPGCLKRYTDPSSLRKHVKTYKHYAVDTPAPVEAAKLEDNSRLQMPTEMQEIKGTEEKSQTHRMEPIENHVSVIRINNANKIKDSYHMESPTTADNFINLKAVIDIKNSTYGFVNRCEGKRLYKPYDLDGDRLSMDLDMPLDLSIRRNM